MGYSPWGHKRVGNDLVTKQQYQAGTHVIELQIHTHRHAQMNACITVERWISFIDCMNILILVLYYSCVIG